MLTGTDGAAMFLVSSLIAFLGYQSGIFTSGDYQDLSDWQV